MAQSGLFQSRQNSCLECDLEPADPGRHFRYLVRPRLHKIRTGDWKYIHDADHLAACRPDEALYPQGCRLKDLELWRRTLRGTCHRQILIEAGTVMLNADQIFGADRYPPLGLNAPRAIAAGQNGDIYVADSRNHRILHIGADGNLLKEWGTFADQQGGNAPIGTFNEPWGVAVGPDGSVYVSDTWNHRVQKFTKDGKPVKMWGQYGQPVTRYPESSSSFWGPRGIAVDLQGHVFVADTGNKRIVVFDSGWEVHHRIWNSWLGPRSIR